MSERAALLRHIIEHPDDDAARLVMADWLDEHGEPERAEFVRLQVQIAQEDVAATTPIPFVSGSRVQRIGQENGRAERLARLRHLFGTHREAWLADVAKWARRDVDFCRGFISRIDTSTQSWLRGAGGLHRAAPVSELTLFAGGDNDLPAIAARPQLAHVSHLHLRTGDLAEEVGQTFADSAHVRQLRVLQVVGSVSSLAYGLSPVVGGERPALRQLTARRFWVGDAQVERLAANPALPRLASLQLQSPLLSEQAALALAASPHLGELSELSLERCPIGDEGVLALIRSTRLSALTTLNLSRTGLTAKGFVALAGEPGLARVRHLNVSANDVGDAGLSALASSRFAANLRRLEMRWCDIGEAGAMALARSTHLGGLAWIALGGNVGGPKAAELERRFHIDLDEPLEDMP